MNSKEAKKIRQLYRREVKGQFDHTMEILKMVIRKKPRLLPAFIWYRIIKLVIKDVKL